MAQICVVPNLTDVRILKTDSTRILQLDPILAELNDLQRQPLLHDADLNGVAFDSTTVWPAGAAPLASATTNSQLALAPAVGTAPTTTTTSGTAISEIDGLPSAKRLEMNFFINSIRNVRTETGEFNGDFYLDLFWNEPELSPEQDISDVDPATLKHKLNLINSKGSAIYLKSMTIAANRTPIYG